MLVFDRASFAASDLKLFRASGKREGKKAHWETLSASHVVSFAHLASPPQPGSPEATTTGNVEFWSEVAKSPAAAPLANPLVRWWYSPRRSPACATGQKGQIITLFSHGTKLLPVPTLSAPKHFPSRTITIARIQRFHKWLEWSGLMILIDLRCMKKNMTKPTERKWPRWKRTSKRHQMKPVLQTREKRIVKSTLIRWDRPSNFKGPCLCLQRHQSNWLDRLLESQNSEHRTLNIWNIEPHERNWPQQRHPFPSALHQFHHPKLWDLPPGMSQAPTILTHTELGLIPVAYLNIISWSHDIWYHIDISWHQWNTASLHEICLDSTWSNWQISNKSLYRGHEFRPWTASIPRSPDQAPHAPWRPPAVCNTLSHKSHKFLKGT